MKRTRLSQLRIIVLSVMLTMLSFVLFLPSVSLADTRKEAEEVSETVFFEDGSYLVTEIIRVDSGSKDSTIKANKTSSYYGNNGVLLWKVVLSGSFSYTGTSSVCTNATCSSFFYDSAWSEKNSSSWYSGNTAYCSATIVRKILGITVYTIPVSISLSCSSTGELS